MLACGGLGGIYKHSTNYRHITGDALAIAKNHGIRLEHIDYIQIHPTTLYSEKPGRRFLISESVRGEGAILLNKEGNRFVNELLPRDLLTKEVHKQMAIDDMPYVRLSMAPIPKETIISHFQTFTNAVWKRATTARKSQFLLFRHSIILWVVSGLTKTATLLPDICMRLARRAATVYTEKTV